MVEFDDMMVKKSLDQNQEARVSSLSGSGALEVKTSNEVMKAENAFSVLMMRRKVPVKSPTRVKSKKRTRKPKN